MCFRRASEPSIVLPVLILLPLVLLSAASAFTSCSSRPPLEIGFVGGLSGIMADVGTSGRDGAILAVENRNAAGGVRGRKVVLEIRDDGQNAEKARAYVHELADRGIFVIIGPITSTMSVAVLPAAESRNVLLVSPSAMTEELTGKKDLFVRTLSPIRENASRMADYLRDTSGVTSVAAVADLGNRDYTLNWIEAFKARLAARGGRVARVETFTSSPATPFLPMARRISGSGAQAVLISASAVDAAMIGQQLRRTGWKGIIGVTEWASTEKFLSLGGSAVEGVVTLQLFDRESRDPRYLAFAKAYGERFGAAPGYFSVLGYDAANVVLDALEKSDARGGEALRDAILRQGSFQGIQETISFDPSGDGKRGLFFTVVRNGKYEVVR